MFVSADILPQQSKQNHQNAIVPYTYDVGLRYAYILHIDKYIDTLNTISLSSMAFLCETHIVFV